MQQRAAQLARAGGRRRRASPCRRPVAPGPRSPTRTSTTGAAIATPGTRAIRRAVASVEAVRVARCQLQLRAPGESAHELLDRARDARVGDLHREHERHADGDPDEREQLLQADARAPAGRRGTAGCGVFIGTRARGDRRRSAVGAPGGRRAASWTRSATSGAGGVVRHEHDADAALAADVRQQREHLAAALRVEAAGRLVGEHERAARSRARARARRAGARRARARSTRCSARAARPRRSSSGSDAPARLARGSPRRPSASAPRCRSPTGRARAARTGTRSRAALRRWRAASRARQRREVAPVRSGRCRRRAARCRRRATAASTCPTRSGRRARPARRPRPSARRRRRRGSSRRRGPRSACGRRAAPARARLDPLARRPARSLVRGKSISVPRCSERGLSSRPPSSDISRCDCSRFGASGAVITIATPASLGDRAQHAQHLLALDHVEVRGRLVGEQQPRAADQRVRERDARALAVGQLVPARRSPPAARRRARASRAPRARACAWLRLLEARQRDVVEHGQAARDAAGLPDAADVVSSSRARARREQRREVPPSNATRPPSGVSMPAATRSSVVLPERLPPQIATKSPGSTSSSTASSASSSR